LSAVFLPWPLAFVRGSSVSCGRFAHLALRHDRRPLIFLRMTALLSIHAAHLPAAGEG